MANNVTVGGSVVATQDISGVHHQKTKATGATVAASGTVSVTTSASTVRLALNANRRSLVIANVGTVAFKISPTNGFTFANQGITIPAGGVMTLEYTGAIYAATAAGTGSFEYWEDSNA